ncbi:Cytochrome c oxidase subunit 4, mitochondrial [Wickerhamiella sorbophila]|uniref:Cytochrome c oxidase subunit 4, mitochondrial n=1 Tax=Wickerhamiella sorbophila TaxID=45607 RepID=A0A2T0FDA2_9ASCO|nr:Cytochrome c oxidase subunit 4, mitochondrial [Wickerhamiella sorbophila]PRT52919.1 Cytochrome c oxidase subunit 4, mitochondrial [Wickerhamiella sorbophila]
MNALRQSVVSSVRRATVASTRRALSMSAIARGHAGKDVAPSDLKTSLKLEEATGADALLGPGGKPGQLPTSFEIATGLERLELLGALEGIDVFDEAPLTQERKGTPDDPVIVDSYDRIRYVGCTGFPTGSQEVNWLRVEEGKISRDWESGCCYTLNYLGPKDAHH